MHTLILVPPLTDFSKELAMGPAPEYGLLGPERAGRVGGQGVGC